MKNKHDHKMGPREMCTGGEWIYGRNPVIESLRAGRRTFSEIILPMLLCSGAVGRNPLRTRGRGAQGRLLSILGIAGDGADTHAPMAGDIPQAIFLCGFAAFILCFTLCVLGFVLFR